MTGPWNLQECIPDGGTTAGFAQVSFEEPPGEISGPANIKIMPDPRQPTARSVGGARQNHKPASQRCLGRAGLWLRRCRPIEQIRLTRRRCDERTLSHSEK